MSKLKDMFEKRQEAGTVYRNVPTKRDGDVHPLNYVYPDDIRRERIMNDDVVLSGESVSLDRDIDRISKFEKTQVGARFLDRQILLQQSNPFAYTRNYREDNLKDHVDPTVHKPRHGYKISIATGATAVSIPGEFTFVTDDVGKMQGETADKLVSSSGPVYLRLSSKEGMLNTGGLTFVDLAAAKVRRWGANIINNFLDSKGHVSKLGQLSARLFGTSAAYRPEIETRYLEQIWEHNRGLQRVSDGGRYGQVYLGLEPYDESGTYRETFGSGFGRGGPIDGALAESGIAPGFHNLQSLRENDFLIVNLSVERQFNSIVRSVSRRIHRYVAKIVGDVVQSTGVNRLTGFITSVTGGRVRLPNPSRTVADYVTKFLPRAQDITLLRNIRRFFVGIDDVIDNVNRVGSVLQTPDFGASNIRMRYYRSKAEEEAKLTREMGADNLEAPRGLWDDGTPISYLDAMQTYKQQNKIISIGLEAGSNTTQTEDGKTVFVAQAWDNPYYKDWMQADNPSVYREHDSQFDSDSIDVIFRVFGQEEAAEVRFRAFIEDINETVTPTYNENKYIGRYETFYTYDRVTRDVGFSLRLHAFSEAERDLVMQKMAYLTSLAYPESSEGSGLGYLTPLVTQLTIGRLYVKQPCIVQTLTHTIENDTSWDIDRQTPMSVLVGIGVRLLDKKLYTHSAMVDDQFTLYLKDAHELIKPDHPFPPPVPTLSEPDANRWNSFAGPRPTHDSFGVPLP